MGSIPANIPVRGIPYPSLSNPLSPLLPPLGALQAGSSDPLLSPSPPLPRAQDQTVRLWDASTGAETHTLKGHTIYVLAAAFSPDGARVVSGSDVRPPSLPFHLQLRLQR